MKTRRGARRPAPRPAGAQGVGRRPDRRHERSPRIARHPRRGVGSPRHGAARELAPRRARRGRRGAGRLAPRSVRAVRRPTRGDQPAAKTRFVGTTARRGGPARDRGRRRWRKRSGDDANLLFGSLALQAGFHHRPAVSPTPACCGRRVAGRRWPRSWSRPDGSTARRARRSRRCSPRGSPRPRRARSPRRSAAANRAASASTTRAPCRPSPRNGLQAAYAPLDRRHRSGLARARHVPRPRSRPQGTAAGAARVTRPPRAVLPRSAGRRAARPPRHSAGLRVPRRRRPLLLHDEVPRRADLHRRDPPGARPGARRGRTKARLSSGCSR